MLFKKLSGDAKIYDRSSGPTKKWVVGDNSKMSAWNVRLVA